MTPEVGHTIQWRRANGRVAQMVVDLVHHGDDGTRWLFSRSGPGGTFIAVNQQFVLVAK